MADDRGWNIGGLPSGELGAEQADRARQRAEERDRRAQERVAMAQARTERRTAEREQSAREREEAREARRLEEAGRLATLRPERAADGAEADAAPKRRKSGALARTGEARIERDTRHYRTVVDQCRIRELSRRGATVSGLATVFGISIEEVEAVLAEPEIQND